MGLINKELSFEEEKGSVAKSAAQLCGLKPYFYTEDDYTEFLSVLDSNLFSKKSRSEVKIENLPFTYHPDITVTPLVSEAKSDIAKYVNPSAYWGFVRLGLTDTLIRPNLYNVQSCHKVGNECRAENGNLGYICNPWWASYALFSSPKKKAKVHEDNPIKGLASNTRSFPNPVAVVNVMLGSSIHGNPIAFFSIIHGDVFTAFTSGALTNLCNYFLNQGFEIRVSNKFLTHKNISRVQILGMSVLIDKEKGRKFGDTIMSGVFMPSITSNTFPRPDSKKKPERICPYRYPDVSPTCYLQDSPNLAVEYLDSVGEIYNSTMYRISAIGDKDKVYANTLYDMSSFALNVIDSLSAMVKSDLRHSLIKDLEAQKSSTTIKFWDTCCVCGTRVEHGNTSCKVLDDGKSYCENCSESTLLGSLTTKKRKPTSKIKTSLKDVLGGTKFHNFDNIVVPTPTFNIGEGPVKPKEKKPCLTFCGDTMEALLMETRRAYKTPIRGVSMRAIRGESGLPAVRLRYSNFDGEVVEEIDVIVERADLSSVTVFLRDGIQNIKVCIEKRFSEGVCSGSVITDINTGAAVTIEYPVFVNTVNINYLILSRIVRDRLGNNREGNIYR